MFNDDDLPTLLLFAALAFWFWVAAHS